MNNERRRVVHGSYSNQEDLIAEITRLQNEGYKQEDIVVYSSSVATDTDHDEVVIDPMKRAPGPIEGAPDMTDGVTDPLKRAPGSEEGIPDVTDGKTDPRKRAPGSTDGPADLTDGVTEPRKQAPGSTGIEADDLETPATDPKKKAPGSTGVEDHHTGETHTDNDESMWDKVKGFFTKDTYDHEKELKNPNYRKENDILYPHREDLAGGKRVIVLDKPNEEETRINI